MRAPARARSARRRAHRAAVPGAPPRRSSRWLQERSALPIVADESCVLLEDLDALVGVVAGVNVKLAKCGGIGPAKADARAGARARLPDVPRLHGGDVGRDRRRRRPSRRWPTGSTSTAACCSPTTRSRGSSSAATTAGSCRSAGLGLVAPAAAALTARPRRSARAFTERPFVWITWWTKSWTSPLPASRPRAYDCRPPAAERPRGRAGDTRSQSGPTGRPPVGPWPRFARPGRAVGRQPRTRSSRGGHAIDGSRSAATQAPDPDADRIRAVLLPPSTGRLAGAVRRDVRGRGARPVPRLRAPTTWPALASGSACSTCRHWPSWPAGVVGEEQALRRPIGRRDRADVAGAEPSPTDADRRRLSRDRGRAVVATPALERSVRPVRAHVGCLPPRSTRCTLAVDGPVPRTSSTSSRRAVRTQARMRRLAISPSIWRSAST